GLFIFFVSFFYLLFIYLSFIIYLYFPTSFNFLSSNIFKSPSFTLYQASSKTFTFVIPMDEQYSFDTLCELTFAARIPSHSDQEIRSQRSIESPQTISTEQYPPPSPVIPRSRRQNVATFQEQRTVRVMEEVVVPLDSEELKNGT